MAIFKKLFLVISSITFLFSIIFTIVFFNEFNTLLSVDKIDDTNKYYVEVEGDYYLDEFIKAGGADSVKNLSNFLSISITKGLPIFFNVETKYNYVSSNVGVNEDNTIKSNNSENDSMLIVKTNPFSRYSSISTVDLSYLNTDKLSISNNLLSMAATYFPLDGINEKGLTASVNLRERYGYTNPEQTDKLDVTETVMLRIILDNAATVQEAQDLIESYDLFSSGTNDFEFIITDIEGNYLNYKFDSKGTYYVTKVTTTANKIESLSDIINENNLFYSVVYNSTDKSAQYYFSSKTNLSNFTVTL